MRKRNSISLGVLGIVVIILLFYQTPIMTYARAASWAVWVHTVAKIFNIRGIDDTETLVDQMQELRMENIRLRAELGGYKEIRRQLGSPAFEDLRSIPAEVVSRPIDTFEPQYIINKGIRDGVTAGAPVIVQGSVLLGFVTDLSDYTASVQSLLHSNTYVTVETITENDEDLIARGLLRSKFRTSLYITTVPRDVKLRTGQDVVTTSKDAAIPYGMVIGRIADIHNPENEAYQEARVEMPYDPDMIDAVTLLVPL